MATADSTTLTGTWNIDPQHSRIGFSTRHAMVAKVRGAFNELTGIVIVDGEHPEKSHVEVTVKMASIDTRSQQRDDHLRSADFFDVETYPEMRFVSERIEEVDDSSYLVTGPLTIRDITRTITIPLAFTGVESDPTGQLHAGFEGTRRIDRREWGVAWNTPLDSGGVLVSDKILLEFELELLKEAD
ncbi:MAG: YceI family protein [Microbacterium sp.]